MEVFFLRHATPQDAYSLSERGVQEAKKAGENLKKDLIGKRYAIITSPLNRAVETAKIVATILNTTYTTIQDLHIIHAGDNPDLLWNVIEAKKENYNALIIVAHSEQAEFTLGNNLKMGGILKFSTPQ